MNKRFEIAREFANAIRSEDIIKIILYGSVDRGDDTEESDIDILIVTSDSDELSDEINSIAVDIIINKVEFISPLVMSKKHFDKTKDYPFLKKVLKEGVSLMKVENAFLESIKV